MMGTIDRSERETWITRIILRCICICEIRVIRGPFICKPRSTAYEVDHGLACGAAGMVRRATTSLFIADGSDLVG